jgi:hypothetical protein
MPKDDRGSNYDVGFGKPPKKSQFRKGVSGNPTGRPKGALSMATVLERTLREKVIVNENGRERAITKLEAAVKQLMNKAASGDLKALQLLAGLVRSAEERTQVPAPDSALEEVDKKVVIGILKRFEGTNKEDQEDADKTVAE